jgi:hypothetical protein
MGLRQIFLGVPQSKYAAYAVIVAILAISISILFGKQSMPISQKLGAIFLIALISLPGILYSLFQLTCLVTGSGVQNKRWWCSLYAWLISALLIIYSILIVVIAILSLFSGMNIKQDTDTYYVENFQATMDKANQMAVTNDLMPKTAVSGTSMDGIYPSVPPVVTTAGTTGASSNGVITSSVANSTLLNNSNMPTNGMATANVGTGGKVGTGGPFRSAENPEDYPFKSAPLGHGWEPMNSIDLPPGA